MNKEIEKAIKCLEDNFVSTEDWKWFKNTCITALEAQQADRWIPVTESPKYIDRYYIITVKSTVSEITYTRSALYDKHGFATKIDEEVLRWKPLPKPWNEEQP